MEDILIFAILHCRAWANCISRINIESPRKNVKTYAEIKSAYVAKRRTKGAKISAIVIRKELAELVLKLIRNVVNIQKSAIVVGKKTDVDKDELKNIFSS